MVVGKFPLFFSFFIEPFPYTGNVIFMQVFKQVCLVKMWIGQSVLPLFVSFYHHADCQPHMEKDRYSTNTSAALFLFSNVHLMSLTLLNSRLDPWIASPEEETFGPWQKVYKVCWLDHCSFYLVLFEKLTISVSLSLKMKAATGMWSMSSVILSTCLITLSTLPRYLPENEFRISRSFVFLLRKEQGI